MKFVISILLFLSIVPFAVAQRLPGVGKGGNVLVFPYYVSNFTGTSNTYLSINIGTIGRSHVSIGKLVSENSFYAEGGGGIRWRFHRHWHWEINALYTQTRHFELTQRSAKVVTGIGFQF